MATKRIPNVEPSPHRQDLWDITPEVLSGALSPALQLIDVRQPDEYTGELGHIEGAKLIPLGELSERGPKEITPSEPVVFICRSGGRSTQAGGWALENGYEQVYNLAGGMLAWQKAGLDTK